MTASTADRSAGAGAGTAVRMAAGSLLVGLVVLGLKFVAWWVTGSVALLSDALESIINVVAALAALAALRVAARPADQGHPYGHHKAEYFSAVLEGGLIIVAAVSILREAWFGFLNPTPLDAPALGLAVNAVASVINGIWAMMLVRLGRRWCSPALVADGKHLFADVLTSGGVLIGVALVAVTGWLILDPLLAAVVAVNILWTGYNLVVESLGGLMDSAVTADMLSRIRAIVATQTKDAIQVHKLRTRVAGPVTFVDFHLVVPGRMTVAAAHAICDRVEAALETEMPNLEVTIHVEPEDHLEPAEAR